MTKNAKKLRSQLDENKYSDDYINSLLSLALDTALAYTKRESLPNVNDNDDILAVALSLHNNTEINYSGLSKYITQNYLNGYENVIVVDGLPPYQELDQIYAIIGKSTTKFFKNGQKIAEKNNDNDNSPYTDQDGNRFIDNKISGGGASYRAGNNITIAENVISCSLTGDGETIDIDENGVIKLILEAAEDGDY